ncbi:hypothetical protein Hanom_Chr12g01129531 [Helianthus anomalus]
MGWTEMTKLPLCAKHMKCFNREIELNAWLVPMVCKNYRLSPNGLLITHVIPKLVKK